MVWRRVRVHLAEREQVNTWAVRGEMVWRRVRDRVQGAHMATTGEFDRSVGPWSEVGWESVA